MGRVVKSTPAIPEGTIGRAPCNRRRERHSPPASPPGAPNLATGLPCRPTGYDLNKLTIGVARELGLHSDCVNAVCQKFADARRAIFPKTPKFRSFKRNLDWIPVTRLIKAATQHRC
jgi:hypothetical protein